MGGREGGREGAYLGNDLGADEVVVQLRILPFDLAHKLVSTDGVGEGEVTFHHSLHHFHPPLSRQGSIGTKSQNFPLSPRKRSSDVVVYQLGREGGREGDMGEDQTPEFPIEHEQ